MLHKFVNTVKQACESAWRALPSRRRRSSVRSAAGAAPTAVARQAAPAIRSSYVLINAPATADSYFQRLQQSMYRRLNQERERLVREPETTRRYLWESGRIAPGRPYVYIKPLNERGWLFERSGLGWVISRCEKIVGQDLFLRQEEPWDIAALYEPNARRGACRVVSQQTGGDLISFAVYEQLIINTVWSPATHAEPTAEARTGRLLYGEPELPL